MVPFAALDAFWRALWSIQAAALGVDRAAVQYAPAAQLERGHLMASAHYSMCPELVHRLAEPATWAKVDLGLRLRRDLHLWDADRGKRCSRPSERRGMRFPAPNAPARLRSSSRGSVRS